MLFSPWVGLALCVSVCVVRPSLCVLAGGEDSSSRWASYFAVSSVTLLPLSLLLPAWVPLRHELLLLVTLFLSDAGGAEAVRRRYLLPLLTFLSLPAQEAVRYLRETDTDTVLSRVEDAVRRATDQTKPDDVSSEAEEEVVGEDE